MRRIGLVAAWLLVTAIVTFGAWQFVDAASSQVSDQPLVPLVAPETSAPESQESQPATTTASGGSVTSQATSTTSSIASPSSSTPATTSTTVRRTTSTTSGTSSSTTTSGGGTTSTSSPTTSTNAGEWKQQTVTSPGGNVRVSYRGNEVRFETAQPAAGFRAEVEKTGPEEVRVDFDGDGAEYEVRIRSEGGVLQTSISESDDD